MTDRLSTLVRAANPAPDPDTALDTGDRNALFAAIEKRTGIAGEPVVETVRQPRQRRRWAPALAAGFATVVAITVALVLLTKDSPEATSPTTTLPLPGQSDSPTDVIGAFFSEWNDRDIEGALSYLHPDAHHSHEVGDEMGSVAWWENYLNYSVAAYGGDWEWILRDCTELDEKTVQCRVGVQGEPLLDARLVPLSQRQFGAVDGYVTRALVPRDMTLTDIAVDQYAKEQDPEGHAAVCGIEGRDRLGEFVVYDRACGEFTAPYRLALAAELLAPTADP